MTNALDAKTKLYGVLGYPVKHSLSPLLHNAALRARGLNAVYLAFEVPAERLGFAFEALRSLGAAGFNLTLPHKETAVHLVDEIPEDLDRAVGAINTVVNRDGVLYGHNTDVSGFLWALGEELRFKPIGKKILVLGAGGAARAVLFALARAQAGAVRVMNRTQERAAGLVEYLDGFFPELDADAVVTAEEAAEWGPDLIVNATSLGLDVSDPSPIDLGCFKKSPSVYDLIYRPAQTPLLEAARMRGFEAANGLGMLAAQAALSFELWTGQRDGVRESMLESLKACVN